MRAAVVAVPANTPTLLAAGSGRRQSLAIQNQGAAALTLAFDTGVGLVAGTGFQIAAGATLAWEAGAVPSNAVFGTSGSPVTVAVIEG